MSICRKAALQVSLLLVAMFAHAASRKSTIEITVLDSQTRALPSDDNGVPTNCEQLTFDAYCRSTRNPQMISTLLVQEGNNPPIRISCRIESKFSRCQPLPKGETFEARRDKHGITVYYIDDKGKARSQLYTLVDSGGKPVPSVIGTTLTAQAVPSAAPQQNSPAAAPTSAAAMAAPTVAAPARSSPAAIPPAIPAQSGAPQKVKCNFISTPAGAEITVDWRYVGNTPSEIGLSTGTHVVVISMPGFAEWKRELTVAPDSAVNVTATLQKAQP
jgi:hypothetical protein